MSLTDYAAQFGSCLIGRDAALASQSTAATAVQTEADAKRQSGRAGSISTRSSISLTTYQQAYTANAPNDPGDEGSSGRPEQPNQLTSPGNPGQHLR